MELLHIFEIEMAKSLMPNIAGVVSMRKKNVGGDTGKKCDNS